MLEILCILRAFFCFKLFVLLFQTLSIAVKSPIQFFYFYQFSAVINMSYSFWGESHFLHSLTQADIFFLFLIYFCPCLCLLRVTVVHHSFFLHCSVSVQVLWIILISFKDIHIIGKPEIA